MQIQYTLTERIFLACYRAVFSDSNISLKKYSRIIYIICFFLLLVNIATMYLFGHFEEDFIKLLSVNSDKYQDLTNNFGVGLNILEVGLGLAGAFLDFTPEENKLSSNMSQQLA